MKRKVQKKRKSKVQKVQKKKDSRKGTKTITTGSIVTTPEWLFDSLAQFELQDPRKYV